MDELTDNKIIGETGLDNILNKLTVADDDIHPEKRMRQAWNDYLEKNLPIFRENYPNQKRNTLVNMIQKEVNYMTIEMNINNYINKFHIK